MSLRSVPTRRLTLPAVGLTGALLLAGCGAGQQAQTYQGKAVADATNTSVGAIAVRNLAVMSPTRGLALPAGSDAPMTIVLVNESAQEDVLLSASTPAASSVDVVGPTATLAVPGLATSDARYSLELRNLTAQLQTGTYITLTLRFQRNGEKQILVPVAVTPDGAPKIAPSTDPGAEAQ